MTSNTSWHYENFEPSGSAIGYRITRKLDEVQSPFQKIEIFETTDWGNLMLIDGAVMLTTRDNFLYHEMMSHPALFTHANPKQVVIIGGGDCGTLREVLKHPGVERAVQCDIDEQVTRMAEKYFPELCDSNHDPRAELLFDALQRRTGDRRRHVHTPRGRRQTAQVRRPDKQLQVIETQHVKPRLSKKY